MARLQTVLRKFNEGRYVEMMNGLSLHGRDKAMAEMRARFDHLAGVPVVAADTAV